MRKSLGKFLLITLLLAVAAPMSAYSADEELLRKIDALSRELEMLKQQVQDGTTKLQQTENKVKETEDRSKETEKKVAKVEEKSLGRWLSIGGDYRFRYDYLHGTVPSYFQFNPALPMGPTNPALVSGFGVKNNSLYTNRFGLNLTAKATQDVTVTTRLLMYKIAGSQDDSAINGAAGVGPFFARPCRTV